MGTWIFIERGLGGIVVVTPIAVEVCLASWWNDQGHVRSGCDSCAPVDCAWSRPSHRREWVPRFGPPWLAVLPEGSMCPSSEAEVSRGVQALLMTPRGLGRGGKILPKALISPETSPQGLGGMEFVAHVTSD
jgi:hypothetical protein